MPKPKLENYKISNDPSGLKAYSLYRIDKKLHVANMRKEDIDNILNKLKNHQHLSNTEISKLTKYSKLGIKYLFR